MRNRDLRPTAKANPTIQQAFERFQKYNRLKNLSQGSLDFYAAKGRSFFRFLGDTEQPIHTITEKTVEDYIFYMKDQKLQDTTINTNLRMVRAFLYWCMEKGYLEQFSIKLVRADDPIKEPYTTDELQKLLKEPDCKTCSFAEYRNWVIVNFLLGTGCRACPKWVCVKLRSDLHVLQRSQITTLYIYLVSGGGISDFPFSPVIWGRMPYFRGCVL